MPDTQILEDLGSAGKRSRDLKRESRSVLVSAIRRAASAGYSQREISRVVGLSQPEVSRLLRFSPASPRGRKLSAKRAEVLKVAAAAGFRQVRVFGSVARGDDGPDSDIDLLVAPRADVSLFDIARLEQALTQLLGEEVEVVPDNSLETFLVDRVHSEAVPL